MLARSYASPARTLWVCKMYMDSCGRAYMQISSCVAVKDNMVDRAEQQEAPHD